MVIEKYGIRLESITPSDLELIRYWRNKDHVRLNMHYRGIITEAMQSKWYQGMNKANNIYFIMAQGDCKIGLINLKEIDRSKGIAEAGIFIGDTKQLNSFAPIPATIALMEFAFDVLKLNKLLAKVASDNEKAVLFNEALGYHKSNLAESDGFSYYETGKAAFMEATEQLRPTLQKLSLGTAFSISDDERALYSI